MLRLKHRRHQLNTVTLAPHLPADWTFFALHNLHATAATLDVRYEKTTSSIDLEIQNDGTHKFTLAFEPAVSLRAKILSVEQNGRRIPFHVVANDDDQHVLLRADAAAGLTTLRIHLADDFGVSYRAELPMLGSVSEGLRILSESWSSAKDQLTLSVSGVPDHDYELSLWNPSQISSVDGAELIPGDADSAWLHFTMPPEAGRASAAHSDIVIHFAAQSRRKKQSAKP